MKESFLNFNENNWSKLKKDLKKIVGESSKSKINRVVRILNKKKIDYFFVSSGENICWLMNIRGKDLPNSPVANCNIILTKNRKIYFFSK